jgi:hypothetical protein
MDVNVDEVVEWLVSGDARGVNALTALRLTHEDDAITGIVTRLSQYPDQTIANRALWIELHAVLLYALPATKLAVVNMMDDIIPRGSQVPPEREYVYAHTLICFEPIFELLDDAGEVENPGNFRDTVLLFAMNHCSNPLFAKPLAPGAATFIKHFKTAQAGPHGPGTLYARMAPVLSNMISAEAVAPIFRDLGIVDLVAPLLTDPSQVMRVFGMLSVTALAAVLSCVAHRGADGCQSVRPCGEPCAARGG